MTTLLFADLADALTAATARGWRVRGSGLSRLPWRISPTAAPCKRARGICRW
jgi:hypothetical protein